MLKITGIVLMVIGLVGLIVVLAAALEQALRKGADDNEETPQERQE